MMLRFDEEKLKKLFMEELRYSKENAEDMVGRVKTFDERLQPILDQWMEDRTLSDVAINGVTIDFVMKNNIGFNFYKALVDLQVYAEHPDLAEHFLNNPERYRRRPRRLLSGVNIEEYIKLVRDRRERIESGKRNDLE